MKYSTRRYGALLVGLAALVGSGIWQLCYGQDSGAGWILWLLAAGLGVAAWRADGRAVPKTGPNGWDAGMVWGCWLAALLLGLGFSAVPYGWVVWLIACSFAAWFAGAGLAARLATPLGICIVLLPMQSYWYFLLSFPMSRICSWLTVGILQLCGVAAVCSGNMIELGQERIAVTAACSGVEQLEALFLIGWLIVYFQHRRFWVQVAHFAILLPIILLCNTLRLVIVLGAFLIWGEAAFGNTPHTLLGFGVVLGAVGLMWSAGWLFTEKRRQ